MKKALLKNKKRTIIIGIIILIIAVVAVVLPIINKNKDAQSVFDITPTFSRVSTGDISIDIYGDGNIDSGYSQNITSTTALAIDKLLISDGNFVEQGQVIAYLDKEKMQENFDTLTEELNQFQQEISSTYKESEILYIKAPIDGRLKDVHVEEEDLVEDAMEEYGYMALVVEDRMKIVVDEATYNKLKDSGEELVIRTDGYKYKEDITLEIIDDGYCVVLPTARRDKGDAASVYLESATHSGDEIFTGVLDYINPVEIKCNYGVVDLVDDEENNSVEKGEVLYHVEQYAYNLDNDFKELNELREEYESCKNLNETLELVAPVSGIYTELKLNDGEDIERDELFTVVKSNEDWVATVAIDELDINGVQIGQKAVVTVDAIDGQEFEGTVQSISSSGVASGGITTYDVEIAVDGNEGFKVAMTVACEIQVESSENTLLVPASAIKTMGNKSYVIVEKERTDQELAEIKEAITDNDMTVLMGYFGMGTPNSDGEQQTATVNSERQGSANRQAGSSEMTDEMKAKMESMDGEMTDEMKAKMAERSSQGTRSGGTITDPTDLLFGEVVFVETGLQDTTYVEVLSGLDGTESILTATKSNAESNSDDSDSDSGMAMNMGGMMGGGSGPPAGGGTRGSR